MAEGIAQPFQDSRVGIRAVGCHIWLGSIAADGLTPSLSGSCRPSRNQMGIVGVTAPETKEVYEGTRVVI